MPVETAILRARLTDAGYQLAFRGDTWTQCLVVRGAERWAGVGANEDEALADALARMLPSHLARELLARASAASLPPAPISSAPAVRQPSKGPPPTARLPGGTSDVADTMAANDGAGNGVSTREEAGAALGAILDDIEAKLPTVARLAPERQRLVLSIWIARARAVQETFAGDHDVELRTLAVARRITDLAKMFWPGAVHALRAQARPADAVEARVPAASSPRTWAAAAALAEAALTEQIAQGPAEGLDADGWVEPARDVSSRVDPDRVVADAASTIEAIAASGNPRGLVADNALIERLLGAARGLRWARRRARDAVAWGVAMGHLRRLLPAINRRGKRIDHAIDPRARPDPPW